MMVGFRHLKAGNSLCSMNQIASDPSHMAASGTGLEVLRRKNN